MVMAKQAIWELFSTTRPRLVDDAYQFTMLSESKLPQIAEFSAAPVKILTDDASERFEDIVVEF